MNQDVEMIMESKSKVIIDNMQTHQDQWKSGDSPKGFRETKKLDRGWNGKQGYIIIDEYDISFVPPSQIPVNIVNISPDETYHCQTDKN
jgi:hypothetical protein